MGSAAERAIRTIARNVKTLRTTRGWSLDALAARSGVSKGMLVQLEQMRTNPSIATLGRLADAFGVALTRLVEAHEPPPVKVVRSGDAAQLWHGRPGSVGRLLVGSELPAAIEMWDWHMAAGDGYEGEAHAAGSQELLYVLRGRLTLRVAEETITLLRGDAAAFVADRTHSYRNPGDETVHFVMAVLQPEVALPPPPQEPPSQP
ncbi:XRE family transcriptional regulator [Streptomyces sp. NPDC048106]|uniref:helix-turn-helix domain-containing protein n=1 Tax=Streptomyces sp. NPDC048106 TaxID=3155750 RepID=UPI003455E33C